MLNFRFGRKQPPLITNWKIKLIIKKMPFALNCTKRTEAILLVCANARNAALVRALRPLWPPKGRFSEGRGRKLLLLLLEAT